VIASGVEFIRKTEMRPGRVEAAAQVSTAITAIAAEFKAGRATSSAKSKRPDHG
jgi:hypothetical protein